MKKLEIEIKVVNDRYLLQFHCNDKVVYEVSKNSRWTLEEIQEENERLFVF